MLRLRLQAFARFEVFPFPFKARYATTLKGSPIFCASPSRRRGRLPLRQFWQVTDSMSKCSPKVIQNICLSRRKGEEILCVFQDRQQRKTNILWLLVHLLMLLVACGAT